MQTKSGNKQPTVVTGTAARSGKRLWRANAPTVHPMTENQYRKRRTEMTKTQKTWKIRDQLPNGKWGPEREVTLAQYRQEIEARKAKAIDIFRANVQALAGQ
jgi:hypothetical protein